MSEDPIVAFTDGAAKGNPGPGGWGAIVVTPDGHVTELGGGAAHTTNNRMELCGAIAALEQSAAHDAPLAVYTDSSYVIKGITQWVWSWRRRGWKTAAGEDVLNRDLWEALSGLVEARGRERIDWRWVKGHVGTPGNERADQIAVAFALQRDAALYTGPVGSYALAILDLPERAGPPERSASGTARAPKGKPHAYLSVVDGVLMRHATWAECERRVKGRAGARFKKAMSPADEAAILAGWGIGASRP